MPANYGHWKTVYNRHRRWSGDGTWEQMLDELRRDADVTEGADWTIGVDAGVVRAHQHAAGPVTLVRDSDDAVRLPERHAAVRTPTAYRAGEHSAHHDRSEPTTWAGRFGTSYSNSNRSITQVA